MKTLDEKLTKKDLIFRWQVTKRTVEREIRRFGLRPVDYRGRSPIFTLAAVEAMEKKRVEVRSAPRHD